MLRRIAVVLAFGLAATLLALAAPRVPLFDTLEWKVYDQLVRWAADPSTANRDIVLVAIDEKSVRLLEPLVGRWPWPRLLHAQLVDFLTRAPAKVIAYDVLFSERDRRLSFLVGEETWSGAESDRAFAESVGKAGNVVMAADATFEGLEGEMRVARPLLRHPFDSVPLDGRFEERPVVTPPYQELEQAAFAIGHNLFVLDADGPVRRAVPLVRHAGHSVPSLGLAAALVAAGIPQQRVHTEGQHLVLAVGRPMPLLLDTLPRFAQQQGPDATGMRALVDYRGPAVLEDGKSTVYPIYSFYDLFYSQQALLEGESPSVAPSVFRIMVPTY